MPRKPSPPLGRVVSGWRDADAEAWAAASPDRDLGVRVYTSRLLGAEPSLVLCGGGNTSVKSTLRDLFGQPRAVLWVKGSGADLAEVTAAGFAPVDLLGARRLLELRNLSDTAMLRALRLLRLDPEAPTPSCEALLHAFLPARFIEHTHADAVLAILDSRHGSQLAAEIWGADHLIVPYVKPGFDLARLVRELWLAAGADAARWTGLVLLHHGIFTFGESARQSYQRMLGSVERARRRLVAARRPAAAAPSRRTPSPWTSLELAALRRDVSRLAGKPLIATTDHGAVAGAQSSDARLRRALARGPITPDHVLRTKPWPLAVATAAATTAAVARYGEDYAAYFTQHAAGRQLEQLDPAPRVALLQRAGLVGFGETARAAGAALAIATHTAATAAAAQALGGYRPLAASELFEVEYWELEQAKLKNATSPAALAGRVALVSGAARGIGAACLEALRRRGAAVVGIDRQPLGIAGTDVLAVRGDATNEATLRRALERTVERFGGLDVLVLNLGVFTAGEEIEAISSATWQRAFTCNVDAGFRLLRAAIPALAQAPFGASVIVIGSRNVLAPGPGAAAYSASKAALTQLARVAALELAPHGVRVNVLHPDAVFDTDLWNAELLAQRARHYGLSVEQYKRRNLLACEVRARDVGELAAALATDLFAKTTGAQIPVDGGSDRVV
jgi:rhamnose utilization protein RhaD (predicted bifunctional aldolase and dehydrogenase)/NAD(P)-dependent dehydrogenase (short-subunit alcohol dehydrogenase family)